MAGPLIVPLSIYRGDSYRWQYVFWLDDAKTQPMDLTTGVVVAATIRHTGGLLALVCNVAGNQVDVVLSAVDSEQLFAPEAWDLQLTYAAGDVQTVVAGPVTITPDVTGSTP